jgi:hypothetical protein
VFDANIVGIGFGAKQVGGRAVSTELAVRVYVRSKLPTSALPSRRVIPRSVDGLPTDVVEVGEVVAQNCGGTVAHVNVSAGTLGCLAVRDEEGVDRDAIDDDDPVYILSNNHVLADNNDANIGDSILQPAPHDGGFEPQHVIATLSDFVPINFGGTNSCDVAIARLKNNSSVRPEIMDIGRVGPPAPSTQTYQSVRKRGRTTAHTVGVLVDTMLDIDVSYGDRVARFTNQLAIAGVGGAPFSLGGDSGSLIVDALTLSPVGLLFGGGTGITIANPIDVVMESFGGLAIL